ncbi:MAG: MFS transporter [Chloroflexi bacterium]|nr:MAG: MFS transporter [Chloroflexota bacterium]
MPEKLPVATKLAYGAGDFGTAIVAALKGFFLLIFLTDVARLDPAAAGSILLITKIWDAVNDPMVGWLSDRTRTRWGRRRPWILFGAIPFGLLFFLLWLTPPLGDTGKYFYYLLIALLGDAAFTAVNLPYTALTPELTRDYDERTSLNSYRFGFSIAGALIAAVLHPQIVQSFATPQAGYTVSAAVWGVLVTIPCFVVFAGTRERPERLVVEVSVTKIPYWEQLRIAFANRPYRFVIGLYLLSWFTLQLVQTVIIYFLTYYLRRPDQIPLVLLAVQSSSFLFLFVWSAASRRLDKRLVYMMGATIWLAVQLALFFVTPDRFSWVIPLAALAGAGVAVAYLIPWAMMPDVIEYDELETGQRREGIFYGFMVFLQKACLALGIYLVGLALSWTGYITPSDAVPTPVQPERALAAMRVLMGPAPALILAASLVLAYFYPITRAEHARVRAALRNRAEQSRPDAEPS